MKKASFINHVRVFGLFLIIDFFCHNLETFSLAIDWPQTINLYVKVVIINSFSKNLLQNIERDEKKVYKCIKFCYKQIEPAAPVKIRKHLTVCLSQNDISHPVLTKQQNRKHTLFEKNSIHCFTVSVRIRDMIFL